MAVAGKITRKRGKNIFEAPEAVWSDEENERENERGEKEM